MENPRENLNEKLEYENIFDIHLQEVQKDDPHVKNTIIIRVNHGESNENIKNKVQEELIKKNWWLQDYWTKKGIPNEQISIKIGEINLEVYNFSAKLQDKHIEELKRAIKDLNKIQNGIIFKNIKYILIDDKQAKNPRTGENLNGYSRAECNAIQIYPEGLRFIPHRIKEASNFEGTIIHEFAHNLNLDVFNKWRQEFGWKDLDKPKQLSGGAFQYHVLDDPKRCVSDYAVFEPQEDLCESLVAALRSPGILDSQRAEFINRLFQKDAFVNEQIKESNIDIKVKDEICLPKTDQPVYFEKKEKLRMKIQ